MRLSTLYMYQQSAQSMSARMSQSNETYLRMSAGKTLLKASDDPAAATDAVKYKDALAKLELYSDVRSRARGALEHEDNILNGAGNLLTTTLKEKLVAAGSDAYSDADRNALGKEIEGIRQNLLDLANSRDGNGRYIFGGFQTAKPPYLEDGTYELSKEDIDYDAMKAALSAASQAVDAGIDRLGKAQAELGTNLQQLEALDMSGDVMIIDMKVKVDTAIGADTGVLVSLMAESQMSELALNASMYVYKSMQKMNLFNS